MALRSGRVGIHPSQVDPITGMLLSGPSGSTNYNDLSNKPQINGVTLSGNKTTSDLHIEAGASDLSDLDDVQITNPQDGECLMYDSTSEKWINSGEAPTPTYIDIVVTIYGAVEDTISFTDVAGVSHSEVFASGQSSKAVLLKINPIGSTSITFTSAVAKDPADLSNDYTKTVSITSATTSIYVMPDNALYWYGYFNSLVAHKWQRNPGGGSVSNTENTNSITISGYGSGTSYDLGMYLFDVQISSGVILKAIANASSGQVGIWDTYSPSENIWLIPNKTYTTANALTSYTLTANGYPSFGLRTIDGSSISFSAFWYE